VDDEAPREEAPREGAAVAAPPALSRARRALAAVRAFGGFLREHYGRMDPRTAGLYRIVVGLLCSLDCIRHWASARVFYSNDGVLTNHWHLFKPSSPPFNFSFFHAFSTLGEVHVAFALALFCHLCLMVGWHSRLFAVLSFILVTSLDNRLVMVENGGYVVVNLVTLYACFLPLERRFSVDALRRSYRERRERTAADLDARYLPGWATDDYVSLAVFLVVLNLSVVYFFNVINKNGELWRKGETVHYVLYLNRMVTGVAVFFRNILPMWATRVLTWSTICIEGLLMPWILWPFGRRLTRTLAVFGIWTLHVMFGVMFRLGPFAWFMIGWSFTLIGREQWALLDGFYRRRAHACTVVYDRTSPLAFAVMRLLSRLNGMDLLHFEESPADEAAPPPLFAARDDASGARFTGSAALREIAQALPGGKYAFPALRLIVGPLFAFASARREGVARFFGLTLPAHDDPRRGTAEPSPLARTLRRYRAGAREVALAYFALCAVWQAVNENKSIPAVIRDHLPMPRVIQATISYPRLYQGWGMFAPNPITDDGTVVVDGRTVDGRRIDPFSGKEPELDLTRSDGLGLGQIQQDYFNRIRLDRNREYRQGLSEYLRAWHLRTGRPADELVAFDVYWVRDQCPKPGMSQPYANETIPLVTWRKPGYRPPPGQPPLPPEPKVQSAETPAPDKAEPRRIFGVKLPAFMQ
jgi:Vitamin K-dependent gamma-carboxylase